MVQYLLSIYCPFLFPLWVDQSLIADAKAKATCINPPEVTADLCTSDPTALCLVLHFPHSDHHTNCNQELT